MAKRPFTLSAKICKSCGSEKKITEFYSNSRAGFLPRCKPCHNEWIEAKAATKAKPASKRCKECGEDKPADQFYPTVDGRLFACCKVCEAAKRAKNPDPHINRAREWRERNPGRVKEMCKEWRAKQIAENPNYEKERYWADADRKKSQRRESHQRHKAKRNAEAKAYREANLKEVKAYLTAYWKANPDKAAEYQARRRARERNAEGTFTAADLARIRKQQRDRCGACRKPLNGGGHADHIIALANGGSNWPSNIQLLCPPCNGKKRAKDPISFMQEMGYLI